MTASGQAADAAPKFLAKFPDDATQGGGANQLQIPRALATDPNTGHLFVADQANDRISEFDPWGAFVKAWGWGVADGSSALQTCGPAQPEVAPPPALCREGLAGSGPGQLDSPNGVAVDENGDIYVLERQGFRVQKFNGAGQFLLMFGGQVNKTTNGNVCTAISGDECGVGVEGAGDGEFIPEFTFIGGYIAVGSDGTVYVGDRDRIQRFEPDGTFRGDIPLPESGNPASLAFDSSSGDLYTSIFHGSIDQQLKIYRLDPETGAVLDTLHIEAPPEGKIEALTADADGNVFAIFEPAANGFPEQEPRIFQFDPSGNEVLGFDDEFGAPTAALNPGLATTLLGLGTNAVGDIYVAENNSALERSSISAYGPPPIAFGPPPQRPPTIADQFAVSVDTTGALVKARINPHFWDDTRFYVEYGTESCAANPCAEQPTAPGSLLSGDVVNAPLTSAGVSLQGLEPNTTYHYRFVAESSGGGPVKGLSGKAGPEGEATFTTPAPAAKQPPCPVNQAFRPGPGAFLPDCRAYEMVSPVDKNGADISILFNVTSDPAGLDQAAGDGEKLTYSAYRAFGEVESSPYTSQYLATRTEGVGWASRGISPPRRNPSLYPSHQLDSQYKGFSADLCHGWLLQDTDLALAEGAVGGSPNVYRRDLCGAGYATLAPLRMPTVEPVDFVPEVEGFSADGSKAIFVAKGRLTNNASAASQLYEASEGVLRMVCIRPNNTAVNTPCSAGTGGTSGSDIDRSAAVDNAISDDGSRIYWTEAELGPGKLFVRVGANETIQVSGGKAQFWTAAADGSKAIYSVEGEAFEFDLASKTSTPIAAGLAGVLGASEDASKVYLASTEVLAGGAVAGKPNLYLYEAGPASFTFIGTLSQTDVDDSNRILSDVATWPIRHVAKVTPDGDALAFISSASLTGFDNTDAETGQPVSEVYVFRRGSESPTCVSCLPSGARPAGHDITDEAQLKATLRVAALLPPPQNQVHSRHLLSDDGSRLFFESFDPLSLRDVNGQKDVYQWEALGSGNCTEDAPGFNTAFDGCVNLISSGESPQGSDFVDAGADGRDVFFKTGSSLLPQDPGLVDVYDARVGGGFPLPAPPAPECEGEACQHPVAPPGDPAPSSSTFVGPGNTPGGKAPGKKKHRRKHAKKKHSQRRASR